jgi:predicted kinase
VVAIVLSGPQATGKTTLALALGNALGVPVFSRDPLMQVLQRSGVPWRARHGRWVPAAGLRLQTALLARQLELGQSAILECIAPLPVREDWRQMCRAAGCRFVSVECTCTDAAEHRARFERRLGPRPPARAWGNVTATIRRYRADPEADFRADAIRPVADLVAGILVIAKDHNSERSP